MRGRALSRQGRAGLVAVALLVGCDSGQKKPIKVLPPGPYVVKYECSHSMEPWGRGGSVSNQAYDLGAKTYERLAYEYGDPTEQPPDVPQPERKPVVSPLPAERVAAIEAAVQKVLRGGPYKEELPVSEGISCTLLISNAGGKLLELEKSYTNERDAATELVRVLGGGA